MDRLQTPIGATEFAELMAAVGPFEPGPRLAVAVSGGADSLALCLLVHDWAAAQGGTAQALTVDHGLRQASAQEARQVRAWLARAGIRHHVLRWHGPRPETGIQAAARAARYQLLGDWCRHRGILHLLLAHHMEDQAETFLLRLAGGSGVDGLAAMAAVAETPGLRLLRPLLTVSRARLAATLRGRSQDWIEDPSNQDMAYARVRLRRLLPVLAREGLGAPRLAASARRMGRTRVALERATGALLARAVTLYPAGYAEIDHGALLAGDSEIGTRALARVLMCVGGRGHPPRGARLERLHGALAAGALSVPRTLGGCRLIPRTGRLLVCREPARAGGRIALAPGTCVRWDNRFALSLGGRRGAVKGAQPGPDGAAAGGVTVARLGQRGWAEAAAQMPALRETTIPAPVRPSLPALWDEEGLFAVPHLAFRRPGGASAGPKPGKIAFSPPIPLAGVGFSVA